EPLEQLLDVLPLRSEVRGRPGLHLVAWKQGEALRRVVFADALGAHEATSEELAEAALQGAALLRSLGEEQPRVAFVADVSYGAGRHPSLERLERARDLVRVREEGLAADGPLAADVALDPALQARYPGCALGGAANVLVFPGRVAARAALDLLTHTGQAEAIGPLLWGLRHPVGFAERGAGVDDLTHLGLVTTALAIQVDRAERKSDPSPLSEALEEAVSAFLEAEHA
ncbi:MAG TPA: hypothetical protein DEA08_36140, partial [Planctomycetes bacterium]|nr:hypothetical protein [Planctomycetota bacterium]